MEVLAMLVMFAVLSACVAYLGVVERRETAKGVAAERRLARVRARGGQTNAPISLVEFRARRLRSTVEESRLAS